VTRQAVRTAVTWLPEIVALTERDAWLALAAVEGVGEETLPRLVSQFRSARQVFIAALDGRVESWNVMYAKFNGRVAINAPTLAALKAMAANADEKLSEISDAGLWTYTSLDADYPPRLRDLDPPPAVIYGRGDRQLLFAPRLVALVGTRRPTPAGRVLAGRVAARLSEFGAVVVSGGAVGIDGVAHAALVDRRAPSIGVIGGGHMHPGPRAHERLRAAIVDTGGALISEHHPTVSPTKGTYPRRNRIIAALGDATIVVEAPRISGALITARKALELGRPTFVAPGRVGDWSVAGSLGLMREAPARPLVGLDELIEDLGYLEPTELVPDVVAASEASVPALLSSLGPTERAVAERLKVGPVGLDDLVAETGLPPGAVSSAVTLLLMRGWAQSIGPAYVASGALAR
jgi:DNA processing protein